MSGQYHQLAQIIDIILQKVNGIHVLKFGWNLGKKILDDVDVQDMNLLESVGTPFFDPYIESRQMFVQCVIQSDVYITNSNFTNDTFLKRFVKQRDKVQTKFDKTKPNSTKLTEKIGELRVHLDALEQHGRRVSTVPSLNEPEPPNETTTKLIAKGKPFDAIRQVAQILETSKDSIKIMDRYVSEKTLEFLATAPDVQIKIITTTIESQIKFDIFLRRINEERTNPIKVKICDSKEYHDRYIITKKEVWSIGGSLKDVGYKTWSTINKIDDEDIKKEVNNIFDRLWTIENN